MGVQVTRDNGRNYADNIIDSLLGFNTAQTWTTSSGTGSASLDTNLFFFGDSSLKMVNTAPTTDLVVTNSVQSTIIPFDDDYQFSFYMRKDEADEFMTLEVKVFESAVLFDTQTFVLGSETTEDDVNDVWARFVSDTTYNFSKGDEITFTFNLKGKAGTVLSNTTVWIDGLMLNNASRLNAFPPIFSKSTNEGKQMFGVYNYDDDATGTTPISLTSGTWVDVTNDGAGANTFTGGGLSGVTPYNTTTNLFDWTDLELYDTIDVRFDALITTTSANEFVQVRMLLSVGSLNIPLTFISTQFKSAGTYPLVGDVKVVIYTENVRTTDAKFQVFTDGSSSELEVNGWSMQVNKRLV